MKILIAGDGKVGSTLTRQLSSEGHDITIIDSDPAVLETSIERYDVMSVQGNCASMDILRQAGVEQADLLIATTNADEINLLCCMTAHSINPKLHTIARIRSPEYAEQIYSMRDIFALSLTINPEKQAAVEIDRLLKYPGFLKRDTFAKGRVEIVELRVDSNSKIRDIPLSELYGIVKCKVLVCAVLRNGESVTPDGNFVLRHGDRLFVTAPADNLSMLLKNLGIITHKVKRVMIAGGGRVSYYLADILQKRGISVRIVENNMNKCVQLSAILPSVSVVHGDASNQDFLESEGLGKCDALVSLTGIDELNMVISLYGHSLGVHQIITKIGRTDNVRITDSLPIGSIICPRLLCSNTIVRYVRAMQNQSGAAVTVHSIADEQAEAIEFLVDENTLHCGEPLKDLKLKKNILIVCITREEKTEIPNGDSHFEINDTVVIVSSGNTVIRQFNDIFIS